MTLRSDEIIGPTIDCGNCPLDDTSYGCHLNAHECIEFTRLVELSMTRDYERYLHPLEETVN